MILGSEIYKVFSKMLIRKPEMNVFRILWRNFLFQVHKFIEYFQKCSQATKSTVTNECIVDPRLRRCTSMKELQNVTFGACRNHEMLILKSFHLIICTNVHVKQKEIIYKIHLAQRQGRVDFFSNNITITILNYVNSPQSHMDLQIPDSNLQPSSLKSNALLADSPGNP